MEILYHVRSDRHVSVVQGGTVTVGSAKTATIQINHKDICPEHCIISLRSGRVFCRCVGNDDAPKVDDLLMVPADTNVYMEGSQLREGVDYLVPPNGKIYFGENNGIEYVIAEFDEVSGSGQEAMSEMLMKGMASTGSKDVRDALDDTFQ